MMEFIKTKRKPTDDFAENPTYSVDDLISLTIRIETNIATLREYENLVEFAKTRGLGAIINQRFIENGFKDCEQYYKERQRGVRDTSMITGTFMGIISVLKSLLYR